MRPDERDCALLWDMLTYAEETLESLRSVAYERYLQDKTLRLATERRLEIVGEAARQVSKAFRESHPEIPWRQMIGFRHVLAHEYGEIKQDIVYGIVDRHLPDLVERLAVLAPPSPEEKDA